MSEDNKKEVIEKNKEENKEKSNILKVNFFKKVWYSITKIEKYPEMAAEGLGKAISYSMKIIAILAVVLCLGIVYKTYNLMQDGINYLQNEFPEFSYKENKLDINSEGEMVISPEDSIVGKAIIDTKTEDEQKINKYINDINEEGQGVVVLKDKIIVKSQGVTGNINYEYKEIFDQMGITEFTKQDVINYAHSGQIISLYVSIFLTVFIYSFIMYLLTTLSNAVFLSLFGYLTTWIAKIKMRYVAIFNMSVYAITLSTILNMIYIAVNIFVDFNMQYFQVMYVAVAAIYLVAAIFILKVDFTKKQAELTKIAEAQEIIRKQLEEKEKEENSKKDEKDEKDEEGSKENENKEIGKDKKDKEQNKEDKKTKKEKKKDNKENEDNNSQGEPEGSNA